MCVSECIPRNSLLRGAPTCPKCKKAAMKKKVHLSISRPLVFKYSRVRAKKRSRSSICAWYIRNYDFLLPPSTEKRILQLFKYTMKLYSARCAAKGVALSLRTRAGASARISLAEITRKVAQEMAWKRIYFDNKTSSASALT